MALSFATDAPPPASAADARDALRRATAALHEQVDAALPLARPAPTLADYRDHLSLLLDWTDALRALPGEAVNGARLEAQATVLRADLAQCAALAAPGDAADAGLVATDADEREWAFRTDDAAATAGAPAGIRSAEPLAGTGVSCVDPLPAHPDAAGVPSATRSSVDPAVVGMPYAAGSPANSAVADVASVAHLPANPAAGVPSVTRSLANPAAASGLSRTPSSASPDAGEPSAIRSPAFPARAAADGEPAPIAGAASQPPADAQSFGWGIAYVIEGSHLGGQMLYRRLADALAPHPLDYLKGAGRATGARWTAFLAGLRAHVATPQQIDAACDGAHAAFALLLRLHRSRQAGA